jgi:hypothetical protein
MQIALTPLPASFRIQLPLVLFPIFPMTDAQKRAVRTPCVYTAQNAQLAKLEQLQS